MSKASGFFVNSDQLSGISMKVIKVFAFAFVFFLFFESCFLDLGSCLGSCLLPPLFVTCLYVVYVIR